MLCAKLILKREAKKKTTFKDYPELSCYILLDHHSPPASCVCVCITGKGCMHFMAWNLYVLTSMSTKYVHSVYTGGTLRILWNYKW